jgi:predicted dehydrogenase
MTAIGLLSTAHPHAESYATVLDGLPDVEFLGVADDDPERGAAFASEQGVQVREREGLLSTADGVVVCSENATHRRDVEAAAAAGVDVLCEKPLATTTGDATAAVETAEAEGIGLGVAMPLRFSQPARSARALLADGDLGELQAVVGTNRGRMPGGWFADPDLGGGGAAMDHSVHVVDLVHWLTGERVVEVYAELATRMHDIPTEDVNVLSMELSDGTTFSLDGSWSKPEAWHFWGDATVELIGSDGVASVDCFDQTVQRTPRGGDGGLQSLYWGDDLDAAMLREFVTAVEEGRDPETTGREGIEAVAVVEAVYDSARRGEPVTVTY